MWRLRRKTERGWHDGFHINKGDEAKGLCDLLNKLERERDALRDIFPEILIALQSGNCAADCSVDFLQEIPKEVRLVRQSLERELDEARGELAAVTEQRDEARETIATMEIRHAAVMLHTQDIVDKANQFREQRDRLAEVIEAATVLIAAKGRHNTMLAYDGLRDALQSLTPNVSAHTQKGRVRRPDNTENK
jgi:hypothetical protein